MVGFREEGFHLFFQSEGKIRAHFDGETQEAPYKARSFINRAKNIGYVEVEAMDQEGKLHFFLSNTGSGMVLTMPGPPDAGDGRYHAEGFKAIMTVDEGSSLEEFYEQHKQGLAGEVPISDEEWMRMEMLALPQRAVDTAIKIFEPME